MHSNAPVTKKKPTYSHARLFMTMFLFSAMTFGGGYVIVSLMHGKFVDELGWIEDDELLDMLSIAQSAPGPIVVNAAIIVGFRLGGFKGFLASLLGTVLPPLIILSLVSLAYDAFRTNPLIGAILKTTQAGVAAVIADVVWGLGARVVTTRDWLATALMLLAFVATYFLGVNIALIILTCGVIGALRGMWRARRATP